LDTTKEEFQMADIQWDDSLSVGVELIDEQHKMLIQKLADLAEAVEQHSGPERTMQTLDFVIEYTDFHFSTEERHMAKLAYPGRDGHMSLHEHFKGQLSNLVMDFEDEGATQQLSNAVNAFLYNWLVNHIKGVDQEFGAFLKEGGHELKE